MMPDVVLTAEQSVAFRKLFCGARTEIPNGESVSICHLNPGHDGPHEGWCLGSRYVWQDNLVYDHGNREWTEELDYSN